VGIALGLAVVLVLGPLANALTPPHAIDIGVTFSARYARAFGLDAWSTYTRLLDELDIRTVRLPVYWDEVEPRPGEFDFSTLDAYIGAAAARGASVMLVLGYKQPRWPECYAPVWARDLPTDALRQRILGLVAAEVVHARAYSSITTWQVENEPFVHFGLCGSFDVLTPEFVSQEIALVRTLDPRPIMVTDSGELSSWIPVFDLPADEFGATLYRDLWFPAWGLWQHPIPAWTYTLKDRLVRAWAGRSGPTLLSELQAEAWFESVDLWNVPPRLQRQLFPPDLVLTQHLDYARRTQFPTVYLWGVEWWYWMRAQGYPEYVETARRAIATDPASRAIAAP